MAFAPTKPWKLPFITTWGGSPNRNLPTNSAEEAFYRLQMESRDIRSTIGVGGGVVRRFLALVTDHVDESDRLSGFSRRRDVRLHPVSIVALAVEFYLAGETAIDRKSTRLNSSHLGISYAVFCLKKK